MSECPVERISHIGSTAVSGIWAKDIVDVLVEVSKGSDMERTAKIIEANGFIRMSAEAGRISFNRGYTKDGFADKVFHVNLTEMNHTGILPCAGYPYDSFCGAPYAAIL